MLSTSGMTRLKEKWRIEDQIIKGNIARFLVVKGLRMEDLGAALGISRTTMYARYNNPRSLTLEEHRLLEELFKTIEGPN